MAEKVRQSKYGNSLTDDQLSHCILGCAFKVHTELGAGLLETVYRVCLAHELRKTGLIASEEHAVPVAYDGIVFDQGFRIDILVENRFVLELKVVEKLIGKHEAQILSYMRFAEIKWGLLLNFSEKSLHPKGIKRMVNPKFKRT